MTDDLVANMVIVCYALLILWVPVVLYCLGRDVFRYIRDRRITPYDYQEERYEEEVPHWRQD